jgi:hypothetical protein
MLKGGATLTHSMHLLPPARCSQPSACKRVAEARTLQELQWGVDLLAAREAATGRRLPVFDQAWRVFTITIDNKKNGWPQWVAGCAG